MSEVIYIFNSRIEEPHLQLEETEKFYQLCKAGKEIAGIEHDEIQALLESLENEFDRV